MAFLDCQKLYHDRQQTRLGISLRRRQGRRNLLRSERPFSKDNREKCKASDVYSSLSLLHSRSRRKPRKPRPARLSFVKMFVSTCSIGYNDHVRMSSSTYVVHPFLPRSSQPANQPAASAFTTFACWLAPGSRATHLDGTVSKEPRFSSSPMQRKRGKEYGKQRLPAPHPRLEKGKRNKWERTPRYTLRPERMAASQAQETRRCRRRRMKPE
ncbi:hypothetical protein F4780DRAFT_448619 [Xylariomycetidae sp. FL0641]|nr:hypothetical protein F4780DRAFT_448619 [Xylariomycetidae sp. FL0641]